MLFSLFFLAVTSCEHSEIGTSQTPRENIPFLISVNDQMTMRIFLLYCVVFGHLRIVGSKAVTFGVIRNASVKIISGNTTTISGICDTCLCALISDPSLFAFNCFKNNLTCEMHYATDQNKPYTLLDSTLSEYYFISLPTYRASTAIVSTTLKPSTSTSMGE